MELRKFVVPEFLFGFGARHLAVRYAANFAARRVLVVSDPGVARAGWTGELTAALEEAKLPYCLFTDVRENPRSTEVMAGAEVYAREGCNVIIAIGGGSPMDCAKGIGIVSSNHRHILELIGVDEVAVPGPPLICVPTTAGSSADLSQFAIISDEARGRKCAIISKALVPDVSLSDPLTTRTMDARLTARTGFDALMHAIEAYVSNAHSPFTDLHALAAIGLLRDHLVPAVTQLDNLEEREKMMLAATHAGMAFSNASLGAAHAMAHSLGGLADLNHGEADASLLRYVIAFNYPAVPERYGDIAAALKLNGSPAGVRDALIEKLTALEDEIGLGHPLREMGITPGDLPLLASNAMRDPCMVTNPRVPTLRDIEAIYEQAF